MNVSMKGSKVARVPEVDGDDAAAAARIEGRFDAFDHRVGRAGGGQVAGFGVLVGGTELPPGLMQHRSKEALRIAHLNLAAAQGNGESGWPACRSRADRRRCR